MPSYETLTVEEIQRTLLEDLRFVGGSMTVATEAGEPLDLDTFYRVLAAARALERLGFLAIAPIGASPSVPEVVRLLMTPAGEHEAERRAANAEALRPIDRRERSEQTSSVPGFGESYGNNYGGPQPDEPRTPANDPALRAMWEETLKEDAEEEESESSPAGMPPLQLNSTGTLTWPEGRYREGTTINELERDLLEDAFRAGGGIVFSSNRPRSEAPDYMEKVLSASQALERGGYLRVERVAVFGGSGFVLQLTLTERGRAAAETFREDHERVKREARALRERRILDAATAALGAVAFERAATAQRAAVQQHRLEPAIAIAWNPAIVTPEDYAELVEILGNLARLERAKGITRIEHHGLEITTDATVGV
jgi:hypothetical protein